MASHFKWYGASSVTTVPYNAVYTYPSQGKILINQPTSR